MPLYEFACAQCGARCEKLLTINQMEQGSALSCEKCGGNLKKMMSSFSCISSGGKQKKNTPPGCMPGPDGCCGCS